MSRSSQAVVIALVSILAVGCARGLTAARSTSTSVDSPDAIIPPDDATQAIMAILKAHEENWNRHDMDAWAEMLHEDADWVHWRGGYWHGKAAIKAGHEAIHRTYYKSSRLSPQRVEDLTFLTPEIALAHVRSELSGDERAPGQTIPYRKTFVFTKKNGVWGVRALHNTRILD